MPSCGWCGAQPRAGLLGWESPDRGLEWTELLAIGPETPVCSPYGCGIDVTRPEPSPMRSTATRWRAPAPPPTYACALSCAECWCDGEGRLESRPCSTQRDLLAADPPDHSGARDLDERTVTGGQVFCRGVGLAEVPHSAVIHGPGAAVRSHPDVGGSVEPTKAIHERLLEGGVVGKPHGLQRERLKTMRFAHNTTFEQAFVDGLRGFNRPTNVRMGPDGCAWAVDYGAVRDFGQSDPAAKYLAASNGPLVQIPGTGVIWRICRK